MSDVTDDTTKASTGSDRGGIPVGETGISGASPLDGGREGKAACPVCRDAASVLSCTCCGKGSSSDCDESVVTLRDQFAMASITSVMRLYSSIGYSWAEIAKDCYDLADAMMEQRKK